MCSPVWCFSSQRRSSWMLVGDMSQFHRQSVAHQSPTAWRPLKSLRGQNQLWRGYCACSKHSLQFSRVEDIWRLVADFSKTFVQPNSLPQFQLFLAAKGSPSGCNFCISRAFIEIMQTHYENTPMQYTAIFHSCKNDNFRLKCFDYFHFFAQNIDYGYTLEPPH